MGNKKRERGEGRKDRGMGIGGGERKLDQFIESWSKVLKKYSNKNQVLVFFFGLQVCFFRKLAVLRALSSF